MKIRTMVILFAVVMGGGMKWELPRECNGPSIRPPMPLFPSLFRSSSAQQDGDDVPWRRQDFTAHSLGSDEQIVSVLGGVPRRFPGFAVDFAHDCKVFRPLDAHIAEHADKHGWGSLET